MAEYWSCYKVVLWGILRQRLNKYRHRRPRSALTWRPLRRETTLAMRMRQTIEGKRLQVSKTEVRTNISQVYIYMCFSFLCGSSSLCMFLQKGHVVVPQWLKIMCGTAYFRACIQHPDAKKNDLDHFCIDCLQPSCLNCLAQHPFHKNVKVCTWALLDSSD